MNELGKNDDKITNNKQKAYFQSNFLYRNNW